MTEYIRIDKNEARRAYDTNKVIVMSLNKPDMQIGETVEFEGVTTVTKNGTGGQAFDAMAEEALQWKHRYPGSKGLVWYTPVPDPPAPLSPYDTGQRAEPKVWEEHHRESEGDFGKVDFNDDLDYTVATLYIERDESGYALKGYTNEPLKMDIEDQSGQPGMLIIQPSAALQENVKDTIALLRTSYERDTAEVYWQDRRAMILVPGEKHVRKQLLIMVTDVGEGEDSSAYVKGWADGVRETRLD